MGGSDDVDVDVRCDVLVGGIDGAYGGVMVAGLAVEAVQEVREFEPGLAEVAVEAAAVDQGVSC